MNLVAQLFLSLFLLFEASAMLTPSALREHQRIRLSRVALEQAQAMHGRWDVSQRDCSGFVRFVYREALTGDAKMWKDAEGELVNYVGAGELIGHNFKQLRWEGEFSQLETGDVLAFYNPNKDPDSAWHLMMVIQPPPGAPQKTLLVYHNGDRGPKGQVRKVWAQEFLNEKSIWQPVAGNPLFKGAYRWDQW